MSARSARCLRASRFVRDVLTAIVVLHAAFVLFVALGGLLVFRWPGAAWLHVPAAAWGAYIELSGGVCPLTPIENLLRAQAGLQPYESDFIAQWLLPLLYPEGLTREAQIALGTAALAGNAVVYGLAFRRRRRLRRA
ncbi:MAG: DUF2784 domain-containing protein [Acidobacteriota bacterium]